MMYDLILIRYGELSLKSPYVRRFFESTLIRNINQVFRSQNIPCNIQKEWGRIYLNTPEIQKGISLLKKFFGITSVSPVVQTTASIQDISEKMIPIARNQIKKQMSFALRVTRTGEHEFTSQEVAIQIGDDVRKATGSKVDLTNPDVELFIEIRNNHAFLFFEKIKGPGGLPLGTQGSVVALIDTRESILAAWYLMRRGCKVMFATQDGRYIDHIQSFLAEWYVDSPVIVCEKKMFLKEIQRILLDEKADAIVTGHALFSPGALSGISQIKQSLLYPVLSPLLAMEKKEIQRKCVEVGIPK